MAGPTNTDGPSPEADGEAPGNVRKDRYRRYGLARLRRGALSWVRETGKGVVTALVLFLMAFVLYRMRLLSEGQSLDFDFFSPASWWNGVRDLVIELSQYNEWLLLGIGFAAAVVAVTIAVRRYRRRRLDDSSPAAGRPLWIRIERATRSSRLVIILATWAAIFGGAWLYQQYLWNVELPVPANALGVALTREAGASVSVDDLRSRLVLEGHARQIVLRELPVRLDPADVDEGRALARRIGAEALVILQQEPSPLLNGTATFVAHVIFADPAFGLEVPLAERASDGTVTGIAYRTVDGIDVPRLATADATRLLEATAGLLLYDDAGYQSAVAHLRSALPSTGAEPDEMEPIVRFHLASALAVLGRDAEAIVEYRRVTALYSDHPATTLQDRLILAGSNNALASLIIDSAPAEAERLLRAGLEIENAILSDPTAASDPGVYRRVHDGLVDTYLGLLRLTAAGDVDEQALWTRNMVEQGQILVGLAGDRRARIRGARALALAGDCRSGYAEADRLITEDPEDPIARRLLFRLASLRDRDLAISLEAQGQLDRLIQRDPGNVVDLRSLQLQSSLNGWLVDPGYFDQTRATADAILRVDPTNYQALADYVDDGRVALGHDLALFALATRRDTGHQPTLVREQRRWIAEAKYIRNLLAQGRELREDAVRLAVELDPGRAEPRLQLARIDARMLIPLAQYAYPVEPPASAVDDTLRAEVAIVARQGLEDVGRALDPSLARTPREEAEAHKLASDIWRTWWFPLTMTDSAAAHDAGVRAVEELEAAKALLDANPDVTGDVFMEEQVYLARSIAFLMASYDPDGLDPRSPDYRAKAKQANQEYAAFKAAHPEPLIHPRSSFGSCSDTSLRQQAAVDLAADRLPEAQAGLRAFLAHYPGDPAARIDLGWAAYLAGELDAARADTARFEELLPADPLGPSNATIIELAAGRRIDADAAVERFIVDLDRIPMASRLAAAAAFGRDLGDLAVDRPDVRDDVRMVAQRFAQWAGTLPDTAVDRHGSVHVLLDDAFVWATLAAGDAPGADAWCRRGLAITDAYAQLRAHCAMAALASGDDAWTSDVDGAGAVALTYADLLKDSGAPMLSSQIAHSELSRASEDARALGSDGGAFATVADFSTIAKRLAAMAATTAR